MMSVVMWRYGNTVPQGGRGRQAAAVAGTKNKANWNYFWLYSLLRVTVNISGGTASDGRVVNEY